MSTSPKKPAESANKTTILLLSVAGILIITGLFLLFPIIWSILTSELRYLFLSERVKTAIPTAQKNAATPEEAIPVDTSFGIVIPKIGANSRVIPNVDPYEEAVYQQSLTLGVAHAAGTVFPGDTGNMFIFAHSAATPVDADIYNAVFYLLTKLEKGDPVYVFYLNQRYIYIVDEVKIVNEEEVSYLQSSSDKKTITLMTCWPAGTTARRLLVRGTLQ